MKIDDMLETLRKMAPDGIGVELSYRPVRDWPNEDEQVPSAERWQAGVGIGGTDMCWTIARGATPAEAITRLVEMLDAERAARKPAGESEENDG